MPDNVLFVVPYVPNLIRVRPYNLIRHLAKQGSRVTVVTLWSDEQERSSLDELERYASRVIAVRLPRWRSLFNSLAALPSRRPLQTAYCWEPALAQQIRELLRSDGVSTPLSERSSTGGRGAPFDVVHVEHLRGAVYGLFLKKLIAESGLHLPIVWDSVDSISLLFRQAMVRSRSLFSRSLTRFELGRTERYEAWLVQQFDRVAVTSPADRQALLDMLPAGITPPVIAVLPNGVDLNYFAPDRRVEREPASLVISGKMSYHANVTMVLHFIEAIMPQVWARRPETHVYVVGKDPSREVLALGSQPNITVTGTVPDLPPYLQKATLAVAPIAYGAGIQNKVLEAMGCATPVVASPQAVSALQAVPGRDLLVAGDPPAFAAAILSLLDDPEFRQQVGQAGRCYVETHHDWNTVTANLSQVYRDAIG